MSGPTALLQLRHIHLSYGRIRALRGVDFDLYPGEIHALVGAHRAGKSSLVKLLSGALRKRKGTILFRSRKVECFSPQSAIRQGIGMVYQHLNIIPSLTATENVFAGRMIHARPLGLNYRRMAAETEALFRRLDFSIDLHTPVARLSTAAQHMVELARVLSFDPRILILDEVSTKFTPQEMEKIYPILLEFKKQGKSIIYISHNMDEIFEFADRVTILKDGLRMDTQRIEELDRIKLIKLTYSAVLSREELKKQNLELYSLKTYNESIIKNIPVGVVILDAAQRIYLINFAAVKILGLQDQNSKQSFEQLLAEQSLPAKERLWQSISGRRRLILQETPYREDRLLKISTFPFRDEDYVFLGTIILLEDITRERRLKDYLIRAEKTSSIAELAAGVAHEINNPLGIVQNYLELLKLRDPDGEVKLKLNKIEHEVQRIERIVGSLLSFSRLREIPFQALNIGEALEEVILLVEHKLNEKNIRLVRKIPGTALFIRGDEGRLKQLFINLLMNSIEAVLGEGVIEVELAHQQRDSTVEIVIRDNGPGIDPQHGDLIFDPFFSTKISKKNAGLGLSIGQHIVELHRGFMSFSSEPGRCTQFRVCLPGVSGSAVDAAGKQAAV